MAQRTEAQKAQARLIAIVLAFVAAAALGVAAFGKRWLTSDDNSDGVSLMGTEECGGDGCKSKSNYEYIEEIERAIVRVKERNKLVPLREQEALPRKPSGAWATLGTITMIASLLAAVGLLVAAFMAIARKRPELPIMPTTLAVLGIIVALITGCIFVAINPFSGADMAVGWTFVVFGAGIVIGLASVFPLNRQIRPIDEELGEAGSTHSWGTSRDDMP